MLPDSKRDLDNKEAGGLGGRKQKERSGLLRPSYLGSLNGFQLKAKGLPWTRSRRGCFPGNLLVPPTGGKASPGSRAWQPPQLPPLVAWLTLSAQANPGSPSLGPGPPATCKDHPQEKAGPRVRQQQTRHEQNSYKPPGQP